MWGIVLIVVQGSGLVRLLEGKERNETLSKDV